MKKIIISTITFIAASTQVSAETSYESEIDANTVAECRASVAATLVSKQNAGWTCSVSTNTGTCTKDGVRAVIYCNGSKVVISMHKE